MFATSDKELIQKISQKKIFKNVFIVSVDELITSYLNSNVYIDIVVLDLDENENLDLKPMLQVHKKQQFIFLATKRQVYARFIKNFEGGKSVVLFKPIKFSAILDNIYLLLESKEKDTKPINLTKNLSVNFEKEKFYQDGEEVFFSPMQHKLMLLLCGNLNKIVTFEMIESSVYETTPSSRIIIQNLVGNLKRTLKLNIKSVYGKGYILQSMK